MLSNTVVLPLVKSTFQHFCSPPCPLTGPLQLMAWAYGLLFSLILNLFPLPFFSTPLQLSSHYCYECAKGILYFYYKCPISENHSQFGSNLLPMPSSLYPKETVNPPSPTTAHVVLSFGMFFSFSPHICSLLRPFQRHTFTKVFAGHPQIMLSQERTAGWERWHLSLNKNLPLISWVVTKKPVLQTGIKMEW